MAWFVLVVAGLLEVAWGLVHPPASSFRLSAALGADLARRPPRIGFGLSFVGAANDLHADHPRQPGT
ncbi:MAG: hypothetical protein MUE69_29795, partial [Myxococcota bacterium]|nr:hypothetical protein [Myxococcota bacterium]